MARSLAFALSRSRSRCRLRAARGEQRVAQSAAVIVLHRVLARQRTVASRRDHVEQRQAPTQRDFDVRESAEALVCAFDVVSHEHSDDRHRH